MATETNQSDGHQTKRVINVTQADTPYTLNRNDCPCVIHNSGATGAVEVTLPQDAKGGEEVIALVIADQDLQISPGAAGAIYASNGTAYAKQTDDKYLNGDDGGEAIHLVSIGGGDWVAVNQQLNNAAANSFSEVEA